LMSNRCSTSETARTTGAIRRTLQISSFWPDKPPPPSHAQPQPACNTKPSSTGRHTQQHWQGVVLSYTTTQTDLGAEVADMHNANLLPVATLLNLTQPPDSPTSGHKHRKDRKQFASASRHCTECALTQRPHLHHCPNTPTHCTVHTCQPPLCHLNSMGTPTPTSSHHTSIPVARLHSSTSLKQTSSKQMTHQHRQQTAGAKRRRSCMEVRGKMASNAPVAH
jgi:hypothetical protein